MKISIPFMALIFSLNIAYSEEPAPLIVYCPNLKDIQVSGSGVATAPGWIGENQKQYPSKFTKFGIDTVEYLENETCHYQMEGLDVLILKKIHPDKNYNLYSFSYGLPILSECYDRVPSAGDACYYSPNSI